MTTSVLYICHVDDLADYRLLVATLLKKHLAPCRVDSFADGQTFVEALVAMTDKPHLILLDQHMPGWTGHQTLVALKQHPASRSIPVVMMSLDASQSEISSFYQAGAARFVAKSVDFATLQANLVLAGQYANRSIR